VSAQDRDTGMTPDDLLDTIADLQTDVSVLERRLAAAEAARDEALDVLRALWNDPAWGDFREPFNPETMRRFRALAASHAGCDHCCGSRSDHERDCPGASPRTTPRLGNCTCGNPLKWNGEPVPGAVCSVTGEEDRDA
jgi:hypothetical protein